MLAALLTFATLLTPFPAQVKQAESPKVQLRPVPDEAQRQNARLAPSLSPTAKAKVQSLASKLAAANTRQPTLTAAQLQNIAQGSVKQAFPNLAGTDIEAVVFIVMMECAQDQQNDLQTKMQEAQQQMAAKQAARAAQEADQASDMSSEQQMQLQMLMDQRSKLLQAISNMMKSAAATQTSIISNLK